MKPESKWIGAALFVGVSMKFLLALTILLWGNLAHAQTPKHIKLRAIENAKSLTQSIWKVTLTPKESVGCNNKAHTRTLYFTPRVSIAFDLPYSAPFFDMDVQGDAGIDTLSASFNALIDPSGDGLFLMNLRQNKTPEDLKGYLPENSSISFRLKYQNNKLFGEASYRGHNGLKSKELDYCLLTFKVTGEPVAAELCNE
jgi:hypothetical protein